jgi:integrase
MSLTKNKYLSADEQQLIRAAILKAPEREQVLVLLAMACGARESELLNITPADLIDEEQAVQIIGMKNSNSRVIPLPPELYARLKALSAAGKPFNITAGRVRQLWGKYRPIAKKFHSFRHTFAIELYKRCRDIRLVQVGLGHKSINSTMVYMQLVMSTDDLRKALL